MGKPSNVQFEPLHNICCVYDENLSNMANFKSILEFMKRLPIQKALTNQHLVFQSHIERFWENATYDKESKTINSIVSMNGQDKPIIITEQLVREVINFPDDENSPTKFPERMVKGCMLRMGYNGPLNKANYLKACFPKPYKFFIHSVLHALSHRKGGYDTMRDYQMNMVTALVLNKKYNFSKIVFHYMVENITSKSKTWVYPRFVQMILDHAYPDLERDENNDLLVLDHMNNEMLKQLPRYHPSHPEPSTKAEFFGFIKDKNYVDPDPVEHQKWRNEKEMKEASYANELKILADFKESRNEWFLKEEKKKRSRKATPKVQVEEGSSSQPKKKRQRRVVETMLVDESAKEDEAEAEANVEGDVRLSPESAKFLKSLNKYNAEKEKAAGDEEGDDVDKSSSSSCDEDIDETERAKRIRAQIEKEKQLKRRRTEEKKDDPYIPSPEHVIESQTPPSSGGRKKASARDRVVTRSAARRKLIVKLPKRTPKSKPPTPPKQPTPPPSLPPEPQQQPSPIQSPLHQSPSRQPTPQIHSSPLHLSPPHQTPIQEQLVTSQQIFQTLPLTQPPVQTTPGSSGYKTFPHVPEGITLEEIGDFGFANDEQVKRLEMEEVLVDNKRLVDHEKKLEKRVKSVEAENSSLLKKIEANLAEIDILKVKVAKLEEEKARRDEQNKYFELKNKELEAAKAMEEHEIYMMNKVLENLLGKSVEQKFEEIKIEEVRARRQEPEVEEGEIRHTYTMNDIIEMTRY